MTIFRYKEEKMGRGKKIRRPVADIFLKTQADNWIEFHPYIDSGADLTLIPLSLGKLLGFSADRRRVEQLGGISGSLPVIFEETIMRLGEEEFLIHLSWAQVENVPPLLGRTDIFDVFEVIFRQYEDKVIFEKRGNGV